LHLLKHASMRQLRYLLLFTVFIGFYSQAQTPEKPNIIFIVTDDMNDYVEGLGGHPQAETPTISSLAEMGTLFTNGFANSVLCAPSRTSFMTGKVPENTGVMLNGADYTCEFRDNFPPEQLIYTFPQLLKDSGGYYTITTGKLFHCDNGYRDFDFATTDPCEKELSWSRSFVKDINSTVNDAGQANPQGIDEIKWSAIDSALVEEMPDDQAVDSIVWFLDDYATNPENYCDKPFMLAFGVQKPHSNLYVPEQYFRDDYIIDFLEEPFDINYNNPEGTFPYNGLVMPPQPEAPYSDYDSLPSLGKENIALAPFNEFQSWYSELPYIPEIDPGLTEEERTQILIDAKRANGIMAYLAAIKFVDELVGRIMDTLDNHPDIYNNTIIVFTSDHGYAWGEKKHYGKSMLWETDIRVPFLIVDLRNPIGQRVTQTASLVDIFPTLLEYGGVTAPQNPDGTKYADGHSLIPIMNNPSVKWESPVLTQVKNSIYSGVCHPQNSVRSERFHFIQFRSNGAGTTSECDLPNSYTQNLLYEVGKERETDPNEWVDLSNDPNYTPVIDYLSAFLPGGALYLQKAYTVDIIEKMPKCLYSNAETVKMKAQVYNPDGMLLIGATLASLNYTWTNNLTAAVGTGTSYDFNLASLTPEQFTSNDKIYFYLKVTDGDGNLVGFNVKYIYINPSNKPNASFTANMEGSTVTIDPYTISGSYSTTSWQMGDGYTTSAFIPGPYTYAAAGTYNIRNIINYGNGCKRTIKRVVTATGFTGEEVSRTAGIMSLYPNPATDFAVVQLEKAIPDGVVSIYNLNGQVMQEHALGKDQTYITLLTHQLPAGMYYVQVSGATMEWTEELEIIR
jgi:arylsulfatase A-like enzyme